MKLSPAAILDVIDRPLCIVMLHKNLDAANHPIAGKETDFAIKVVWRYNFCGTTLRCGEVDCLRIVSELSSSLLFSEGTGQCNRFQVWPNITSQQEIRSFSGSLDFRIR